ncbi:class I SAM-dependent methyltransferase [Bacillus sp. H-16]|uniref:class I SAM-dependent methyltransferase n=1 Tax=Alteribacter salitolerans TaxID=2912333 RepID=UPI001963EC7B|nr:class I SAM-dependent methyltransferase [Alteribacter salitolerans]MBM7096607.1 class I SAM-dependent methyltransferase [Alteribacter salitolerans]
MGHYYSEKPDVASEPEKVAVTVRGQDLSFISDRGVFSKGDLDYGTRVLLEAFEFPEEEGPIADIGCGWGPIGISLAKEAPGRTFVMVDINERAVNLARQNANQNQVDNVRIKESMLFSEIKDERYAAVLTNPPIRAGKQTVHQLFEEAYEQLKENGELWVVIQKKQGAPSAKKKLEELFGAGEVEVPIKDKGYFILRCKKH